MLKTETNTRAVDARVRRAAIQLLRVPAIHLDTFFEHGQWWAQDQRTGAQWSACDAEGADTAEGFCFEQVSQGYDD